MKNVNIDRAFIVIVSIIFPCILGFAVSYKLKIDIQKLRGVEVIKILLGVWATLLGFIITALSILIAMPGEDYLKALRNTKHYGTVLFTYICTCICMLAAIVFSSIVVLLDIWNELIFSIFIAFAANTVILLLLCLFFMAFMMHKMRE